MKVSDNTSISMPVRNLLSIIGAVAVGVFVCQFEVIAAYCYYMYIIIL